jgi:hypothetical protein
MQRREKGRERGEAGGGGGQKLRTCGRASIAALWSLTTKSFSKLVTSPSLRTSVQTFAEERGARKEV